MNPDHRTIDRDARCDVNGRTPNGLLIPSRLPFEHMLGLPRITCSAHMALRGEPGNPSLHPWWPS
jgi:hypothetical protein